MAFFPLVTWVITAFSLNPPVRNCEIIQSMDQNRCVNSYLLNGSLLEGVVGNNGVLAAGVAGSAVGVEDLLASINVASESRASGEDSSSSSSNLGDSSHLLGLQCRHKLWRYLLEQQDHRHGH